MWRGHDAVREAAVADWDLLGVRSTWEKPIRPRHAGDGVQSGDANARSACHEWAAAARYVGSAGAEPGAGRGVCQEMTLQKVGQIAHVLQPGEAWSLPCTDRCSR